MSGYVYIQSEKSCKDTDWQSLWTVGFYMPDGKWEPESDHRTQEDAAKRVVYLNGDQREEDEYESAIKSVHDYLSGLSDEEFDAMLDAHKDGDFVAMLRETGSLMLHAPRAEEPGLREALSKWFEQPVENHLRLDWETGYRCARDEVRDMVDDALSSTHLGQMKEKEA